MCRFNPLNSCTGVKGSDGLPKETCLTTNQYLRENVGHAFDYILANTLGPVGNCSWTGSYHGRNGQSDTKFTCRDSASSDSMGLEGGGGCSDGGCEGQDISAEQPICLYVSAVPFTVLDRPFQQVSDHQGVRVCFLLPSCDKVDAIASRTCVVSDDEGDFMDTEMVQLLAGAENL